MSKNQPKNNDTEAYQKSLDVLRICLSPSGFVASTANVDNYARVWARDGVISGLAALASGDTTLIAGMQQTLTTLTHHQGPHGEIPSNVTVDGSHISYGHLAGRVDALLWYVIGVCAYIRFSNDTGFKDFTRLNVEHALFLAGCWEYNDRGLIYTPISGNWADEYIQQGYVLSDELLYLIALSSAGFVFDHQDWQMKASSLRQMLAVNYWPRTSLCDDPLVYHRNAYRYQTLKQNENEHWLPTFSPGGYATYFDGLAHALALIADLGDDEQRHRAVAYVQSLEQQIESFLLPAFWPVFLPGDPAWATLQSNHLFGEMKNQPYMYHNAGLWPVLTGLYAVGLMRHNQFEQAYQLLAAINSANAQGSKGTNWEFSEYHHGQTHIAMGTKHMAWSAAAGVLAHRAVHDGIFPWLL
jgi:hypothetical protein